MSDYTSNVFDAEVAGFIAELDAAVEAHMSWARKVMRFAVLRTPPGVDVMEAHAHTLCRFGRWFVAEKARFIELDAVKAHRIATVHQAMHDAIRSICSHVLSGQAGSESELDAFEHTQSELISLLSDFKTLFLAQVTRLDPLTGLPLRYGIEDDFLRLRKICARNNTQIYLAMIDIDHFKYVNDQYGHPVGDAALRHLASTLKHTLRPDDLLYRFGGEEFLLLLQCQNKEGVGVAAQRIVDRVRDLRVPILEGAPLALTVTLGIAHAGADDALNEVIARADRALYAGKGAGRDRFVMAEPA